HFPAVFSTFQTIFSHQSSWLLGKSLCVGVVRVQASFQSLFQAIFRPSNGVVLCLFWGLFPPPFKPFFRSESSCYTLSLSFVPVTAPWEDLQVCTVWFVFQRVFSLSDHLSITNIAPHFYRCLVGVERVLLPCFPSPHRSLASSCAWLLFKVPDAVDRQFSWWWANKNQLATRREEFQVCMVFSAFSGQFSWLLEKVRFCPEGPFLLTRVKLLLPCSVLPSNLLGRTGSTAG
ncbi:hypothetical protein Salat_0229500, partial [Sesamum alatum]